MYNGISSLETKYFQWTAQGPIQYYLFTKPYHYKMAANIITVPNLMISITLNLMSVPLSAQCAHLGSRHCTKPDHSKMAANISVPSLMISIALNLMSVPLSAQCAKLESRHCTKHDNSKMATSTITVPSLIISIALNLMSVPLSAHCAHLGSRQLRHKRCEPVQPVPHKASSLQRYQYLDNTLSHGTVTDE
jgi:hypothetical protein